MSTTTLSPCYRVVALLCLLIAVVHSVPTTKNEDEQEQAVVGSARDTYHTEDDLLDSVYTDCLKKDALSCVKYKVFNFVEKLNTKDDKITLVDGVQLVKTGESEQTSRSINSDETIESLIFTKIQRFLDSHTLKVDLRGSDVVDTMRSAARSFSDAIQDEDLVEESRGKKKKIKKVLGPLMAIAGLKMAILGKLALAVVGFIATKALIIGKIALILSAIIGIRKIFADNNQKHVTHEVVAHPHHESYSGSGVGYSGDLGSYGGHGGWQRSIEAQQLAYRGQAQAQESS